METDSLNSSTNQLNDNFSLDYYNYLRERVKQSPLRLDLSSNKFFLNSPELIFINERTGI